MVIPLFQRRYVWRVDPHAQGWFNDMQPSRKPQPGQPADGVHRVGKVIFKRRDIGLICIDGQQRITTTMLFCSALLEHARRLGAAALVETVQRLRSVLFLQPELAVQFAAACTAEQPLVARLPDGVLLPFLRLTPSWSDRAVFAACMIESELNQDAQLSAEWRRSHQCTVKDHFRQRLRATLRDKSPQAQAQAITTMMCLALDHTQLMRVDLLNEVNFNQVFLWYQEKVRAQVTARLSWFRRRNC